jgi:F0F1-type ATP synthase assembly protein I
MSNNNLVEGRDETAAFSVRSSSFIAATIAGFVAVLIDGYLIWRYWGKAPNYVALFLGLLIGVQLVYQWLRVVRYCAKIRELDSESLDQGTPRDAALKLAVGGMLDVLFFSYGIISVALILIGALLARLTHG